MSMLLKQIVNASSVQEVRKALSVVDPLVASHAINDAVKQLSDRVELFIVSGDEGKALYSLRLISELEDEALRYERRAHYVSVFGHR